MKWTFSTSDFVRIALFAAIIAALGIIPLWVAPPFLGGVPISLQTFGVMLAGVVIGARLGFFSVALLIFVVLLGAPILSGGRGGLAAFTLPTTGFLIGWLPGVLMTGWLYRILPITSAFARAITASIIGGIVVIYMFGIPVMAWRIPNMTFDKAVLVSAAFLPLDIVKAVAVGFVARMLEGWGKPADDVE